MATRTKRTATVTAPTVETLVETPVEETPIEQVIETPVEEIPAAKGPQPKVCACGCGLMTKGGTWVVGHDAVYKGRLLRAYDAGDESAASELVNRGWTTPARIAARGQRTDSSDAAKAARLLAKADRLAEQIDDLNRRRDAILAERKVLLGTPAEPDQAEPTEDAS